MDTALDRLGHPTVAAVAWLTLAVAVVLTRLTDTAPAASFVRFAAVLAAGLTAGFALTLVGSAYRRARGGWQAVVAVDPFPFFDHELRGGSESLAPYRTRRPFVLAALAICAAVGPLSVYAFVEALPPRVSGIVVVAEAGEAELARSLDHRASIDRDLGFAIELTGVREDPDPRRWSAALGVRRADGRRVTADVRAGERLRLGEMMLALAEIRATPSVGSVSLSATPRDGGETEAFTVPLRGSATLADGSTIEVTDGAMNRLGQLGPAARIAQRRDGEVVRNEWVYTTEVAVEAEHGTGSHSIHVTEVGPRFEAVFRVADSLPQRLWNPVVASAWMLALAILVAWGARSPVAIVGRTGDYRIVALRPLTSGTDAGVRVAHHLLTPEQVDEWRRVREAVAGEVER